MTKQEWLIAIINGAKGTSNYTDNGEYVQFDRVFMYEDRSTTNLSRHTSNFAIYKEPKKIVKVALYTYFDSNDERWVMSAYMYKDDAEASYRINEEKVKRLNATEIEVEDY